MCIFDNDDKNSPLSSVSSVSSSSIAVFIGKKPHVNTEAVGFSPPDEWGFHLCMSEPSTST